MSENRAAGQRGARLALSLIASLLLLPVTASLESRADEPVNSCENCHRNPDFLVTNKKLYDYYQEWSQSIHEQEGVTCDECHGGDPSATDAKTAHGDGVSDSDPASGIYFKNVPDTCGSCHDEILEGFEQSKHFEHVEKKEGEEQGPTCVTCHGSINTSVLNVNTVAESCARCHNEKTDNHPKNPEKARAILNRFLSIHRFYRYITVRAEPGEVREFFGALDPRMQQLAVTWHTFDLDGIDAETDAVLALLKAKRDQIRRRTKPAGVRSESPPPKLP